MLLTTWRKVTAEPVLSLCQPHINCFVRDVRPIHLDTRSSAKASAERDGLLTDLRWVKVGSALDLHTGLELRQVKEVAAVNGWVLDLGCSQDALHRTLFGVHAYRRRLNIYRLGFSSHLQLDIDGAVIANGDHCLGLNCGESFRFHADQVLARDDGTRVVEFAGVGNRVGRDPRVDPGDDDLGTNYYCTAPAGSVTVPLMLRVEIVAWAKRLLGSRYRVAVVIPTARADKRQKHGVAEGARTDSGARSLSVY